MSEVHKRWSDSSSGSSVGDRDPVEELAAEFADRIRNGDRVSIEQYALSHPELSAEIRELFPMVETMEKLNTRRMMEAGTERLLPKQFGDYRIIGEIARGGMGIVYEAEQVSLGRRVAVKVLPAHALRRERDIRRFEREAQTAASLHHSNIVPVFGVGQENGQRYIVMQLIRGVGLDEVLREIKSFVVDGGSREGSEFSTARTSTAMRSAVGLLDSQLKLYSTSVNANAETIETPMTGVTPLTKSLSPLSLQNPMGRDYFLNVARVGLQAAEALQYAHHNNTLHRDIKPGNLLLDDNGRVWIADFGLAKALQDEDVTCSGDIVGTLAYVAPERFQGNTTKKSDIYSLGVTLHEMLTLQKAFDGGDRVAVMNQVANEGLPSPRKLNRSVPLDLETIVQKAASRDPQDRYESAEKLARDLEAFLEDRPISARRLSSIEHAARWSRRNRGMTALGVAVVMLMATVVGLLAFGYRHADRQRQRFEVTSRLAVGALDEIYDRFAYTSLSDSLASEMSDESGGTDELVASTQLPISKDVASLLENLLDFYDELALQADDSTAVSLKYISANRRVGDINRRLALFGESRLVDARHSYQEAIDRIGKLPESLQDTKAMRLEEARAYNGLGMTYLAHWRGSNDRARSHREAVSILDNSDSSDEEQFELATSLYFLHRAEQHGGSHQRWRRKTEEADEENTFNLDRAQEILNALKSRKPDRPEYDLLLARCLLAKNNGSWNDKSSLQENQVQAIAILEGLIERYPENPDFQYELGQVYQSLERELVWRRRAQQGNDGDEEGQLAASETRLRKALAATDGLEIEHPNIPKHYLLKKELHEFLGGVLKRQGQFTEAISEYDDAIAMQRMLMRRSENAKVHRPWLFRLQLDYGKLLRDAGELEQAEKSLSRTARNIEDLLAQTDSRDKRHHSRDRKRSRGFFGQDNRGTLKSIYYTLSNVHKLQGNDQAMEDALQQAESLGER